MDNEATEGEGSPPHPTARMDSTHSYLSHHIYTGPATCRSVRSGDTHYWTTVTRASKGREMFQSHWHAHKAHVDLHPTQGSKLRSCSIMKAQRPGKRPGKRPGRHSIFPTQLPHKDRM